MQRPIIFICHSLGGIVCKKVHILIPVLAKPEPPVTGFQALILAQTKRYYANIYEKTTSIFFFVCLNSTSPMHIQSSLKTGDSSSWFSRCQLGNCDVELYQYVPILYASSQTASIGLISELNHLGRHINIFQNPGFED